MRVFQGKQILEKSVNIIWLNVNLLT